VKDITYVRVLELIPAEIDLHFEIISFRVLLECVFLYYSRTETYIRMWFTLLLNTTFHAVFAL
jgi:hypothetical protein